MGPNGGGKTTLIKLILGLLKPKKGKIKYNSSILDQKRRSIGYVPQLSFFNRNFPLKVIDVVKMGLIGQRGLFRFYKNEDYDHFMTKETIIRKVIEAEYKIEKVYTFLPRDNIIICYPK